VITRELLDQACKNYFLEEQAKKAPTAARRPVSVIKGGQRVESRKPRGEEWLS